MLRPWPLTLAVTLAMTLAPPAVAQTELPAFDGITTVPPGYGGDLGGTYCGQCGRTVGQDAPPGTFDWLHDLRRQGGDSIAGLDGEPGMPVDGGPGGVGGGPGGVGGGPGGGPSCAPVAPRPPSPMWAAAPRPAAGEIAPDPPARGLTGLATYFTWTGPDAISWNQVGTPGQAADCTAIPAPTATFSATVVRWHWDVGERRMTTAVPETEHTYRGKGTYELSVTCEWAGDPAGIMRAPCGQRTYQVIEARSTPVYR